MVMDAQCLYPMIPGTGHHKGDIAHGFIVGASAAAIPTSSGPLFGFIALPTPMLGVRRVDGAQEMGTNKRKHGEQSPVLGVAQAEQQTIVVDRNLLNQGEKFSNTFQKERERQETIMLSTAIAMAEKRLLAKDWEIMRSWDMNWALGERLRTLYMEAQAWRMEAQSKQTTANVLRDDLEHALSQQAACYHGNGRGDGEDDDESCSWPENHVAFCREVEVERPVVEPPVTGVGMCKRCGESAAMVVLLPCRHICMCGPCAEAARRCPSCGCTKQDSICINFA